MISASRISSVSVFNQIISQAKQNNSPSGTKFSSSEVSKALESFTWGAGGGVSRGEIAASERSLTPLAKGGSTTREAMQVFKSWKASHVNAASGMDLRRRADAFRELEGIYRYAESSPGADRLTASEARALLGTLGATPGPQRVAEVRRLREQIAGSSIHSGGKVVIDAWLEKHPIARPMGQLGKSLTTNTRGLQWPSETDRNIDPVSLGAAPLVAKNASQVLLRAVAESSQEKVELRGFEDTFSRLTAVEMGAGIEEKSRAEKFSKLRDTLKSQLTDLQVFRVGTIDIDVYVLGRTQKGEWAGVMTSVVET